MADLDGTLYAAALRADADGVRLALEAGADPRRTHPAPPSMGMHMGQHLHATPLVAACWSGSEACVELLAPCSPLSWADETGATALMRACQRGSHRCAQAIANPKTCSDYDQAGWTALFYACFEEPNSLGIARLSDRAACISAIAPLSALTWRTKEKTDAWDICFHRGRDGAHVRAMLDACADARSIAEAAPQPARPASAPFRI